MDLGALHSIATVELAIWKGIKIKGY